MRKAKKTAAIFAGILTLAGTAVAQMLPDLTVKDVFMDDSSKLGFKLANESSDAIDPNSDGFIYVYVDGKVAWTYNWKYLKETGFLNADGFSEITSQIPKGKGDVKVCIDARENVTELDENNNCFEVKLPMAEGMESEAVATELPDLAITNISVDPFSGNLQVEHGNIGKGKVSDHKGSVNIYLDGSLKWTYNFSSMNGQFLNPGFTGTITPGKLRGERKVTACTSTDNIIDETNKMNNCLTKTISASNPSLYVRTRKPQTENQVIYRRRNIEKPSTRSYYKPDFTVKDIYREDDGTIYAVVMNKGVNHYQDISFEITFYLEGRRQKSYMSNSFKGQEFLNAEGKSILPVYNVMGGHDIKVCIDDTNKVQERNEDNNCFSKLIK